jgi:hypothetical protein
VALAILAGGEQSQQQQITQTRVEMDEKSSLDDILSIANWRNSIKSNQVAAFWA